MGSVTNVSIVDDDASVRMSIRLMVENVKGYSVVSLHESANSAIKGIPNIGPDIVFMDIRMPGKSGIECTKELMEIVPRLKVVMVTGHLADALIAEAFHAGAIGYAAKPIAPQEIARVLDFAKHGDIYLKGAVSERFSRWMTRRRSKPMVRLTEREIMILDSVKQGLSDREIAKQLKITESTEKTHIRNILTKLDARSRAHAISKYYGYF